MRILVDTDVVMDYLINRDIFSADADTLISLCKDGKIKGCIAAHTVPNIYYILRKSFSSEQRRDFLLRICKILTVINIDSDKLISALRNDDFPDFEDCLQSECAREFGADYIVTRNVGDYEGSAVPVIEPRELLSAGGWGYQG